jgi:hypothetical protein
MIRISFKNYTVVRILVVSENTLDYPKYISAICCIIWVAASVSLIKVVDSYLHHSLRNMIISALFLFPRLRFWSFVASLLCCLAWLEFSFHHICCHQAGVGFPLRHINLTYSFVCISAIATNLPPHTGDDFLPSSPIFGRPLAEQHVYLPYYEGQQMSKWLRCFFHVCSSAMWPAVCCIVWPSTYVLLWPLTYVVLLLHESISWCGTSVACSCYDM